MALSWKPRKQEGGRVYCSPGCGSRCTRAAYDAAKVGAKKLAKRLGKGWKPHVWENMGWHYNVRKGGLQVYPPRLGATIYTAYLGDREEMSGGTWVADAKTPERAIKKVLKMGRAHIEHWRKVIEEVA